MSKYRTHIEVRLQGTSNQYYILRVYSAQDDTKPKFVHTSKKLNYLQKMRKRYL